MRNYLSKIFSYLEKNSFLTYLDNKFSNLEMKVLSNGDVKICTNLNQWISIKKELNSNFNYLYRNIYYKNLIYPFKYSFIPNVGTDNHFIGTIPISKKKGKLNVNQN